MASRCSRSPERGWTVKHRALQGVFVSGVTALEDGTLFASTRGVGMARSDDGGMKWSWVNDGLAHHEFWSTRAGRLQGREAVFAGALPAHLYVSEDKGKSWRELPALRDAKSVPHWSFPPPPRIGHIKDIVLDGDRLWVGVEIGSLQVSDDFGASFTELPVDPDPRECDIHRILVHPARPGRIIIANGIVGMMASEDGGATWRKMKMPADANYPDAVVIHPDQPDLMFMSAGVGWPVHWYELGRARGKIFRSRDAGKTWERLLGGSAERPARAVFRADHRGAQGRLFAPRRRHRRPGVREPRRRRELDHHRRRAAGVEGRFLQGIAARPRQARQCRRHRRQPERDAALAGGGEGAVANRRAHPPCAARMPAGWL